MKASSSRAMRKPDSRRVKLLTALEPVAALMALFSYCYVSFDACQKDDYLERFYFRRPGTIDLVTDDKLEEILKQTLSKLSKLFPVQLAYQKSHMRLFELLVDNGRIYVSIDGEKTTRLRLGRATV